MIVRLKLTLEQAEYSALLESALDDLRDPTDQARFLLRRELFKGGWLRCWQAPQIPPDRPPEGAANEQHAL